MLSGGPAETFEHHICRVIGGLDRVVEGCDPQIDLTRLEAGDLDIEIKAAKRELPELLGEQLIVPGGNLGQSIVGDHEGAGPGRRQVIEAQCRHLGYAEQAACEQSSVTGHNIAVAIDQDRDIKTEGLDAVGDLPDLPLGMASRVGGIGFQRVDSTVHNL